MEGKRGPKRSSFLPKRRVLAEKRKMVGDEHKVAGDKIGVYSSCGVGQNKIFYAEHKHNPDIQRYVLHVIALIAVKPSLHCENIFAEKLSENQPSRVPLNGGNGKVGNFGKGYNRLLLDFRGKSASPLPSTTAVLGDKPDFDLINSVIFSTRS